MKTKTLKRKQKARPGGSLEPVGSAGWHDAPTCAGWWWSDVMEQWSQWEGAGNAADQLTEAAAPWWGPWMPPNDRGQAQTPDPEKGMKP
jgi:hypothetical protein